MEMFTEMQELIYNETMVAQTANKVEKEIKCLSKMRDQIKNLDNESEWDGLLSPTEVVAKLTWNQQFRKLLQNRLSIISLQKKEMEKEEQFPGEWASVLFSQQNILQNMKTIATGETNLTCQDLLENMLGSPVPFGTVSKVFRSKSKPARAKKGKVIVTTNYFIFNKILKLKLGGKENHGQENWSQFSKICKIFG